MEPNAPATTPEALSADTAQFAEQYDELQAYTPRELVYAAAELGPLRVPESLALLDAAAAATAEITERNGVMYAGSEELDESTAKSAIRNSKRETWTFNAKDERISEQIAETVSPSGLKGPAGLDYKRFKQSVLHEQPHSDEAAVFGRFKESWAWRKALSEEIKSAASKEGTQSDTRQTETATKAQAPVSKSGESAKEKRVYHGRDKLGDLLEDAEGNGGAYIDTSGRVRYGGKTKSTRGRRLMSSHELNMIDKHADQIREGLADRHVSGTTQPEAGEVTDDAILEMANKQALPGLHITNVELDKAMLALGYKNARSAVKGVSSAEALEQLGETVEVYDGIADKQESLRRRMGRVLGTVAIRGAAGGIRAGAATAKVLKNGATRAYQSSKAAGNKAKQRVHEVKQDSKAMWAAIESEVLRMRYERDRRQNRLGQFVVSSGGVVTYESSPRTKKK